ncbi:acetolactate synthase AlsS [Holzapfeliella sp. He02]|uniref:Acetolactate synthase AlsS n=1 Tax=Holzapfeliella saturejae TaxID=3082953 RepID=A0ABU8SET8_9LACO
MKIEKNGSNTLIQTMINQGIEYIFGIPGAKIDQLFNDLKNYPDANKPKLIVARHEQNAAFMASGIGRLTGKPGVVLVTSVPGVSNLATGLITATSEGDPVIALGGQVPRNDISRLTHQSIPSRELLSEATKSSYEVEMADNISEVFISAYITATSPKAGASFISIPQDVLAAPVEKEAIKRFDLPDENAEATTASLNKVIEKIKNAKFPVILAGMRSSEQRVTDALHHLLSRFSIPVVETFQAAGILSHQYEHHYFGRVGLFRNQMGDTVLKQSDLVITIGYDPVEYEARNWNASGQREIINIDTVDPEITNEYQPSLIIKTDLANTINKLARLLPQGLKIKETSNQIIQKLRYQFDYEEPDFKFKNPDLLNPLQIIEALQEFADDSNIVTVDVGSHYIWMARYFRSYQPRQLLFSNGMQTLGVALPWAISAAILNPDKKIISVSGDGGFLFSAQELETAVRLQSNIIHLIWEDNAYDMVKFQEEIKYNQSSGVEFGPVDYVKYAQAFGAEGMRVNSQQELSEALRAADKIQGPVIIVIPVDYSANTQLKTSLIENTTN